MSAVARMHAAGLPFEQLLAERMARYRNRAGLTPSRLESLAGQIGVSKGCVTRAEHCLRGPVARSIVELCLVLSVTPNDLLGWDEIVQH